MPDEAEWDTLNESIKILSFKYGFLLPGSWRRKATALKRAADHLYERYELGCTRYLNRFSDEEGGTGTTSTWDTASEEELGEDIANMSLITEYSLLMGYAIENLLKGILMADHPDYFKPGQKITDIRSHNLSALCKRCGFVVSDAEAKSLMKLTEYIEWLGKYPVPLVETAMYPKKDENGHWDGAHDRFRGNKVKVIVDSLYSQFHAELVSREDMTTKNPN
jgi:hypothetical protein